MKNPFLESADADSQKIISDIRTDIMLSLTEQRMQRQDLQSIIKLCTRILSQTQMSDYYDDTKERPSGQETGVEEESQSSVQ